MKNRKSFNSVRFEKGSGKNYVVKSVLSKGNADFFVEVYKMTILETKNLKKYYGKGDTQVKALDGVNLSVEDGEFVAIVGTSGSGKSTLLHMLGGLDRPTSGSVTVDGKNIFSLKDEALTIFRRRKIGFVFQSFNLVPVLTVRENIVLPIQLDGGKVDERYVGEVVTALGLEKKLNSLPGQLSGGQQQRVAIARALANEPKVLLLPQKNGNADRVTEYLFGRGIDYSLIQECIAEGIIFEGRKYHNAVFVGKDAGGTPKYAALRSTIGSSFKGDASGSDKRYSFRLLAKEPADTVHLFEAAIDLLSYATYLKCEGKDYKAENLLSLSGVYQPKKEIKDSKIPIALSTFLEENPHIKTIVLHLDNDKVGRLCTAALTELLKKDYKIVDAPPPVGKDFNDFLLSYLGIERPKSRRERSDAR